MKLRDRQILQIALPSIVSNITVPLLGMIDVAIVGHMGSAVYIGAVAVGSMIFNLVYWLFGFLRMGTSGMTAQALGRRDLVEVTRILVRSASLAVGIAAVLIILQVPLRWLMFWLIGPTEDVAPFATAYFRIVIWGAPASLALFSLTGWYIGMGNTRIPMFVSIMQNVVNIVVSLTLVYGLGMKLEGVALGTVIAQYAGLLMAVGLLMKYYGRLFEKFTIHNAQCTIIGQWRAFTRRLSPFTRHPLPFTRHPSPVTLHPSPNLDIFLRTLCLVAVNLYFTSAGARQGAVILSVNTVMLQLYLFFSYFMDGFAYAGEALGGRFYGARNGEAFRDTLRRLFGWMTVVTTAYTLLYIVGGMRIVSLLTDEPQVVAAAREYIWWAWLIPAAGCMAFIWDGIFIGVTATRGMLVPSAVSALVFFGICLLAQHHSLLTSHPSLLNHGLWLAQVTYLVMRGVLQTIWYKYKIKIPAPRNAG